MFYPMLSRGLPKGKDYTTLEVGYLKGAPFSGELKGLELASGIAHCATGFNVSDGSILLQKSLNVGR